jgi:hypothetical protein
MLSDASQVLHAGDSELELQTTNPLFAHGSETLAAATNLTVYTDSVSSPQPPDTHSGTTKQTMSVSPKNAAGMRRRSLSQTSLSMLGTNHSRVRLATMVEEVEAQFAVDDMIAAQTAKEQQIPRFMISPLDAFRRNWDVFIGLLVIYIAFIVPFVNAFYFDEPQAVHDTNLVFDFFFFLEICLTFCTAYDDNGKLIYDRRQVAMRYLKSWFIIDLIATIPFDMFVDAIENSTSSTMALKIAKVLRLPRILRLMSTAQVFEEYGRVFVFAEVRRLTHLFFQLV